MSNGALKTGDSDVFVLPTTVAQEGFWYLDQLDPGNPAYNIAVRFRLEGPLRYGALERALNEIIRRHESLRTVIADVDDQLVQVVNPSLTIPVPVVDLRDVPAADRKAQAEALTVEEARCRFELSVGPLIRASLLRLDDHEHVLLVTVHHIVSDGWSIGVITSELGALYEAYCRGIDSPLADLPLQYGDFAVWQRRWLQAADLGTQFSYWKGKLANLATLEIPTDRPRPAIQTSNGYIESILLAKGLTEALTDLSHRQGCTFFVLALAALKVLLLRWSRRDDIVVGTLAAGRSRVELESLIGPFINPLVLRTDLSGDPTFTELLTRVRRTVLEALGNQEVPFERLVAAIQPERDPSRHPVFQINFIYQRDFVRPVHAAGLTLTAIPSKSPGAIYDLNFFLVERAEGWRASCEYNTDLYDAATVDRMLDHLRVLFDGIAGDPARRISELPATADDGGFPAPTRARAPGLSSHGSGRPDGELRPEAARRGEIETRLFELWQQVLSSRPIDMTADFFDGGGDSLLAARLLSKVDRAFGRRIPLAAFLQAPTIRTLADHLRADQQRPATPREQLYAIQPKGSGVPIFLVDAGTIFLPLARRMGLNQPLFGLLLPLLSALPLRFKMKDITAYLLEVLKAARPRGPYVLGGWSMAGVLAYDMAQELRARGEEVPLLILFDTSSPSYVRRFRGVKAFPMRVLFFAEKLLYRLGNLRRIRPVEAVRYILDRIRAIRSRLRTRLLDFWYPGLHPESDDEYARGARLQYLAAGDYSPTPYDGKVVLLRSELFQTGPFRDSKLGWGPLIREGLDIYEMPGNHVAMFVEPFVAQLAEKLESHLPQSADPLAPGPISEDFRFIREQSAPIRH
jgi:thioesterase domain-containing protein/acyl carrier protein